jgi:hypothetical protein
MPTLFRPFVRDLHNTLYKGAVDQTIVILEALLQQLPVEGRFFFFFFFFFLFFIH